ncbi:putative orfan [Tupanvirus soda lake]|uniref:Orfan n=2 Tax=Tupanvirus TaxID=2094720 RepID=A0AC62ACM6_9VIRU|nr:putative orfan [Tupanvirus soda lake]QKU35542.1 putative orfan [Tupanvirus soda lake]
MWNNYAFYNHNNKLNNNKQNKIYCNKCNRYHTKPICKKVLVFEGSKCCKYCKHLCLMNRITEQRISEDKNYEYVNDLNNNNNKELSSSIFPIIPKENNNKEIPKENNTSNIIDLFDERKKDKHTQNTNTSNTNTSNTNTTKEISIINSDAKNNIMTNNEQTNNLVYSFRELVEYFPSTILKLKLDTKSVYTARITVGYFAESLEEPLTGNYILTKKITTSETNGFVTDMMDIIFSDIPNTNFSVDVTNMELSIIFQSDYTKSIQISGVLDLYKHNFA